MDHPDVLRTIQTGYPQHVETEWTSYKHLLCDACNEKVAKITVGKNQLCKSCFEED